MSEQTVTARASGLFKLGGVQTINRLGFGAMRVTGRGVWGPPADRAEAIRVLKALPALGVDFIDTANSYGPHVSEELLREALYPYSGLVVATKAGLERPGPERWVANGRPEHLIAEAKRSRERLGVERIDLWQLHRIDPKVPRDEQFSAVRQLVDTGVIRFVGLSEVSVEEIEAASKHVSVATVQNRYNVFDRASEPVLDFCEKHGIGFIPWFPLGAGSLAATERLGAIAKKLGATPGQVALAWLLRRSPVMLPIPGTSQVAHLTENVAAAQLALSDEDVRALNAASAAPVAPR